MSLHLRQYGDVLRMLHWDVLKTPYFNVLGTLAGDVPWRYIEDHIETSVRCLLGTDSGRPWDVILPSGLFLLLFTTGQHDKILKKHYL